MAKAYKFKILKERDVILQLKVWVKYNGEDMTKKVWNKEIREIHQREQTETVLRKNEEKVVAMHRNKNR